MAIKIKMTSAASKIDAGQYGAVVKGVTVNTSQKPTQFGDGQFLKWVFQIHKPVKDGSPITEPVQISYLTSMRLTPHPKNKLNNLLKALGLNLEEGSAFDVESAVGRKLKVFVKDKETEQGVYSEISDMIALPKSAQTESPAPAPATKVTMGATEPKRAVKAAPPPPPVEEVEEDTPPPAVESDDVGDLDDWANLD